MWTSGWIDCTSSAVGERSLPNRQGMGAYLSKPVQPDVLFVVPAVVKAPSGRVNVDRIGLDRTPAHTPDSSATINRDFSRASAHTEVSAFLTLLAPTSAVASLPSMSSTLEKHVYVSRYRRGTAFQP